MVAGLGPIGAVVGGAAFLAGRVGLAVPRREPGAKRDRPVPSGRALAAARAGRRRPPSGSSTTPSRRAREGPLRDGSPRSARRSRTRSLECWRVARSRRTPSPTPGRASTCSAPDASSPRCSRPGYSSDPTAGTGRAHSRPSSPPPPAWTRTIADTRDRLRLLNARLDEAVSPVDRAVGDRRPSDSTSSHSVGEDVSGIIDGDGGAAPGPGGGRHRTEVGHGVDG